ncbi:MAG: 4-demethylwyosine synthase TYW1 [Candidatus Norongarragalinales archaeon]
MDSVVSEKDLQRLQRAGYAFIGDHKHSAVKTCTWTRNSLVGKGVCYKQAFYGISSHRCLQMTPSLSFCTHSCLFCWRDTRITFPEWRGGVDEPAQIIDECLAAQRKLLVGYKGNENADQKKVCEVFQPNQAAISLAGEPTLYPFLGDLVKEFRKRGFTTFLVTNGTNPAALERLADEKALPTQLYVSLCAPDEATYKKVNAPLIKDGWTRLNETLELFASLKTRRVVRLTLCRGLNLKDAVGYARLIEKTGAEFVEPKSYMAVGFSRARLGVDFMPRHEEIMSFARELAVESGYVLAGEQRASRVALLCRDADAERNRLIKR